MPQKLKTANILLKVYGWLLIAVGIVVIVFGALAGLFTAVSDEYPGGLVAGAIFGGSIAAFVMIFLIAWGIFHLVVANAVAKKQAWARIAMIILAILMLGSFPVGTIFGVFIMIGIFDIEAEKWFLPVTTSPESGHKA